MLVFKALRRFPLKSNGAAGLFLSGLFGLLFIMILTPHGFLAGTSSYWQTQVEDIGQYQSGFTAYVRSPWSLPLLAIPSINWPTGTVVTFVDAIPALALPWKVLASIFSMPENPFGFWLMLCFVLQGVGAWYVARQLRPNNWLVLGFIVVLCVWMPSLAARMGHLSLQAHFILLFALGLYFRTRNEGRTLVWPWTILIVGAFYVNFYLTAMAIGIMVACSLDLYVKTGHKLGLYLHAIPIVIVAFTIPPLLGTAFGKAVPDTGFGFYSMNLLSPIGYGNILILPFYKPGPGQYEGYNYLGLGLIIACLCAFMIRSNRENGSFHLIGRCLVYVMTLFIIYSLSNQVYMSDINIIRWSFPKFMNPIFEAFRSSGRFFWPVSYFIIFAVALKLSRVNSKKFIALCCVILPIQAIDLYPTFIYIKKTLMRDSNQPADLNLWNAALNGISTIHAFPKFKCNGALMREIMPLQVIAASGGYNLTTGFISRYGADCDAIASEINASDPATSAYVFTRAQFTDEQIRTYVPSGVECRQLDIWILCRRGMM